MDAKKIESGFVNGSEPSSAVPATRHNIALEPTAQVNLSAAARRERYARGSKHQLTHRHEQLDAFEP